MLDKKLLNTALTITLSLSTLSLSAQEVSVRRGGKRHIKEETKTQSLTRRAIEQGLNLKESPTHRRWEKVIYRFLDLNQPENAAVYYAANTKQSNLFSQIFQHLNAGEIKAYEYLDGVELYDEKHELDFKSFLERFQIPYKVAAHRGQRGKQQAIEVEESNIPSSEVRAYYVKEVWYFDQAKSKFDVEIEAICPVMFASGDAGELPYPLFWLPYEKLRPYINTDLVMLSDSNNLPEASLDDFFTMGMYKGDIVKVKNLLNKSLIQQYGVDSIKSKRDSIERELQTIQTKSFACSPMMTLKAGESDDEATELVKANKKNSRDKRIKKDRKTAKKKKAHKSKRTKSKKTKHSSSRSSSKSVRGRF